VAEAEKIPFSSVAIAAFEQRLAELMADPTTRMDTPQAWEEVIAVAIASGADPRIAAAMAVAAPAASRDPEMPPEQLNEMGMAAARTLRAVAESRGQSPQEAASLAPAAAFFTFWVYRGIDQSYGARREAGDLPPTGDQIIDDVAAVVGFHMEGPHRPSVPLSPTEIEVLTDTAREHLMATVFRPPIGLDEQPTPEPSSGPTPAPDPTPDPAPTPVLDEFAARASEAADLVAERLGEEHRTSRQTIAELLVAMAPFFLQDAPQANPGDYGAWVGAAVAAGATPEVAAAMTLAVVLQTGTIDPGQIAELALAAAQTVAEIGPALRERAGNLAYRAWVGLRSTFQAYLGMRSAVEYGEDAMRDAVHRAVQHLADIDGLVDADTAERITPIVTGIVGRLFGVQPGDDSVEASTGPSSGPPPSPPNQGGPSEPKRPA
jgi:hypothetical protein